MTLAVLMWLTTSNAQAEDAPTLANAWYRIEVIVFERTDDATGGEQLLGGPAAPLPRTSRAFIAPDPARVYLLDPAMLGDPLLPSFDAALARDSTATPTQSTEPAALPPVPAPPPSPTERAAALMHAYEDSLFEQCFQWQSPGTLMLNSQTARLERSGRYRVLLHGAWIAPIPDRDAPLPMLIQAGDRSGDQWRIEGTIAVTLGRYLHADVALRYRLDPLAGTDPLATPDYLELHELRRLRSGELHYLDHPRFGVLLQIDPVGVPDALTAQIDALSALPAQPAAAPSPN